MKFLTHIGIFLLTLVGCQKSGDKTISNIGVDELREELNKDIQLVDVRTTAEYKEGYIGKAVNIDVLKKSFEGEIQKFDKNKPIYIYCRSGKRSANAARKMKALGFTEIYDLSGGYIAWKKKK